MEGERDLDPSDPRLANDPDKRREWEPDRTDPSFQLPEALLRLPEPADLRLCDFRLPSWAAGGSELFDPS